MAGTGLPIPQTGVLAQSPGVVDGDRFSSASAWMQVARAGERIADIGEREQHLRLAGALAEAETESRRKRIELEAKNQFNPAGFDADWKGYTDGRLSAATPGLVPHLRKNLADEGMAAFSSLSNQKLVRDRSLADDNLIARQKLAEDDVVAIAATDGMSSPKFAAAMQAWDGVTKTRVDGGMVAPDAVMLQRENLFGRATGEAIVIAADRSYEAKGFEGALKETQETLAKSGLRPAEQRKYLDVTEASLRSKEVWRRESVKDVIEVAKPVLAMLDRGVAGLDDEARSVIDRLRALKAPLEALRVERQLQVNQGYLLGVARAGRVGQATMPAANVDQAKTFLRTRLSGGQAAAAVDGMSPDMSVRLTRLIQAAPPGIAEKLGVYSGFRTTERQQQLWNAEVAKRGSEAEARKWVAPPGRSNHNHGDAADLSYNGESLSKAPKEVVDWLHQNAGAHGLKFPLANENWHVEVAETRGGGLSANIGTKITGVESSFDPTAQNPLSSAFGGGQFIDSTWLATVRTHRPELYQGRTPQQVLALRADPALSLEMTNAYAKDNAEFLTNAGVPARDGTVYLAHFAGPAGGVQIFKADPSTPIERVLPPDKIAANPFLRGMTAGQVVAWADQKMAGGSGSADLAANMDPAVLQGYMKGQQELFDRIFPDMERSADFWGMTPDNVDTIERMWPSLSPAQREKAATSMRTGALAATFREWTPEAREALIAGWNARAANGDSVAQSMLRDVEPGRKKLAELEENDPIARGQVGNWGRGPTLINWSAPPEQLVGALRARAQDASVYASRLGRNAVPGLSLGEAANLAGVLRTGDANMVARTFGALGATLPQQTFALTMAIPQVKEAVDGLTRSSDPLKMTAVFGALDRMQSSDPVGFGRAFAGDVEKRLALWQSWLAYKSPAELAEAVKAEADPLKAKARAEQRKQAETISEKFSDGQILSMLDPSWLPFDQPAAPSNPDAMARLRVEARLLFGEAYAATGDESAASSMAGKMLSKVWGASEFAGGALMRRPPEKYYPTIDGSHDWMSAQWQEFTQSRPAGEASAYQLVAARETDSDASAGKAPRYEVVFQRPDGAWDVLREADGKRVGFQFDEARAEAAQWSQAPGFFGRLQQNLGADWGSGQPKVNAISGEP
ncbi:hypothetical protein J2X65_004265 [Ancylobacter sp. 3268]|uniref:M15 family metallopeptidase n=1 Tax=Ancylobacter sp. 3268 TaxID=2817752 RepID=UPI002867730E|nr:M15 family metallopeptidase [Ancylobacter sp. 3268]MDR6954889.1 hypothetical protein [Ancylobacter sp. 3268]